MTWPGSQCHGLLALFEQPKKLRVYCLEQLACNAWACGMRTDQPNFRNPPHAKQGDAPLREALLRMRADEACIHHLNIVLADLRPGDRQADTLPLRANDAGGPTILHPLGQ